MWVYGDLRCSVAPADLLAEAEAEFHAGDPASALIALGQLLQGVADAEFEARGSDARSPTTDSLMRTSMEVARHLPFPSGAGIGPPPPPQTSPPTRAAPLWPPIPTLSPSSVNGFRVPEGYAFYALHPALYAAAARRLPPGDWQVIGIRSIGTSLAAVVAAVLGAPPPVTVRPVGHPFDRGLRLAPELEAEWAPHGGMFVIVDEGPGLSGSSFGAVADALEGLSVARERIAFLPGHGGDLGPQASPEHRARWASALRPVASYEDVVLRQLADGVAALVGPATEPLQELSGGLWRDLRAWVEPPPVNPGQERRKHLHRTAGGAWLVKFAGLGRIGRAKLARAQALHAAGFGPEPAGLIHGFLVERWAEDARPGRPSPAELSAYLAFRARTFPADPGASLGTLLEMTEINAGEALGPAAAEAAARLRPPELDAVQARARPVHVDARLHAWEWLRTPDGRLLKADALDHSEAHDLIGPQDIAWDLAGAEVELDLSPAEAERVRLDLQVDPHLVMLLRPPYLAFQLGLWTMAADGQSGPDAARARAQADGYARRLAALLGVDPPGREG